MGKLEKSILEENKRIAEIQEDAKIDKLIRRGFLMEAEEVERKYVGDDSPEDEDIYSEMFDNIMKAVKEKKRKREEEQETEEIKGQELSAFGAAIPKEKPVKNKILSFFGRRRVARWAAVFCVTMIGALAFTVTSEADKAYKMKQIESYKGKKFNLYFSSGEHNNTEVEELITEEEAAEKITSDLLIDVPLLKYKSPGMIFTDYYIAEKSSSANMYYDYMGTIITLSVTKFDNNGVGTISVQGEVIDRIESQIQNIDVKTVVTHNDGEEYNTYYSCWNYKNNFYSLCAYMDGEEYMKILENVKY